MKIQMVLASVNTIKSQNIFKHKNTTDTTANPHPTPSLLACCNSLQAQHSRTLTGAHNKTPPPRVSTFFSAHHPQLHPHQPTQCPNDALAANKPSPPPRVLFDFPPPLPVAMAHHFFHAHRIGRDICCRNPRSTASKPWPHPTCLEQSNSPARRWLEWTTRLKWSPPT